MTNILTAMTNIWKVTDDQYINGYDKRMKGYDQCINGYEKYRKGY